MDSMLKGIFGGQDDDSDDHYQSQAQDFVGRYEQGAPWTNFSGDEAYERYQQVAQHAPPEVYQQSAEQAFSRMDPSQRAEFAQLLQQQRGQGGGYNDDPRELARHATQYQQQNPDGLGGLFGGGGGGSTSTPLRHGRRRTNCRTLTRGPVLPDEPMVRRW